MPIKKERHEILRIAKRLNKFIPLPNAIHWKVHESDVLQRGRVLSLFRTKNIFFPDDISALKMRMITVTRQGYLVIYETSDQGLIVDLRTATHVLTKCDKYTSKKIIKYFRSHIKIRLPRGTVHLYVRDSDIYKWTAALLEGHVSCRPKRGESIKKEELMPNSLEPATAIEQPAEPVEFSTSPLTSSNSGLITVIERPTPSEDTVIPSVRCGAIPVDALRGNIEKDLAPPLKVEAPDEPASEIPSDPTPMPKSLFSLFVFHEGTPAPVKKEIIVKEEPQAEDLDENEHRKEWWVRSLRC